MISRRHVILALLGLPYLTAPFNQRLHDIMNVTDKHYVKRMYVPIISFTSDLVLLK